MQNSDMLIKSVSEIDEAPSNFTGWCILEFDLSRVNIDRVMLNFPDLSSLIQNLQGKFPMLKHMSHLITKPTKRHVRPVKTQVSLGISPVWSVSSLSAWRKLWFLGTYWANIEDCSDLADDQGNLSLRRANIHFVGFVMRWLMGLSFSSDQLTACHLV